MRMLARFGTLPVAVTVLTGITALYYALVAFGNITDYDTNHFFVERVFAMDTTFNDPDVMWRAITNGTLVHIAYVAIIVWEVLTALVLIAAFGSWLGAFRRTDATRFAIPRRLSTLGWTMVLLLFAGGFIAIGGEWFVMWQSDSFNGLQPALQNVLIAGLGIVLAHLYRGDDDELPAVEPSAPVAEPATE